MRHTRRYAVAALERGLVILQTLAASEQPLGLGEVAVRARIPKATTFRLLATLVGQDFVERTSAGAYRLGLRAVQLAAAAAEGLALRRAAQPVLQRLHLLSHDTVNLGQWHNGAVVYVEVLPSPQPLRFVETPGSVAPLHSTALGKAVAAYLPQDLVGVAVRNAGLSRFTPHTLTSLPRLLEELRRVRARGYAIDRRETDANAACVAAPVFDAQGVVGAISISGPASRMNSAHIARLVPALRAACAEVSRRLGARRGGDAAEGAAVLEDDRP
ncbi:MAG: IclR family transcriptional regulator [Armatimonadota bacterium]|nr:IclR family transcriptional regulator [Armatimonadota bacterium]MDR7485252.1 IclR family transcriptional regulator [Armatimonadota bacterium]MDR7534212.1 IclR family transcriptional regulator [Armatimonadota bacterium]MDR7537127.1 IclR family transcriptional regulator [Armatimonadota bacterium]